MCGIAGIVGGDWDRARLDGMLRVQAHRGPDDRGTWVDDEARVGLGQNRLSIIDLSARGHQPMANADGSLWIVFNGEVYNYRELRSELSGYPFRSDTDTEVVLAAFERWGDACLDRFIGMFAIAIWDERRRRLFCARDRIGIKPFHYAWHRGGLYFASEIKALLEAGVPARANRRAVVDYLTRGRYDHTESTFFEGIHSLAPGHVLVWQDGESSIRPYWSLAEKIQEAEARPLEQGWREELDALLVDAIRLRLRADVPVGVHLTGGLDSSSLMAYLDDLMPAGGSIHAFTGTYGDPAYDETCFASQVTRSLDLHLHESPFDLDRLWEIAERTQYHQDQPFGGIATMVYWDMERLARSTGTIVLLEGQGGDELFGGYAYYLGDHAADLAAAGADAELEALLSRYAARHEQGLDAVRDRVRRMQESAGTTYQDGSSFLKAGCLAEDLARVGGLPDEIARPSRSAFTNARYRDLRHTKLPRVLRFNDRMSMSAGCELRVPILDHRVIELSFRIPNRVLLHDGLPKWPLRAAVGERLPGHVRWMPKRAVVTPQREWFRGRLRGELEERLRRSVPVEAGYLDGEQVMKTFAAFCASESEENSFFIWQWINLDLWFRTFGVAP